MWAVAQKHLVVLDHPVSLFFSFFLRSFPQPTTKGELQCFLGMINYYRRFLSGAASILKLITDDTRGAGSRQTSLCWDLGMQWALTSSKQH